LYFGEEVSSDDTTKPFEKLHIKLKRKIVADGEGPKYVENILF
jgi:predicted sulfurtransferase